MCPGRSNDNGAPRAPEAGNPEPGPPAPVDRSSQHPDNDPLPSLEATPTSRAAQRRELTELLATANERVKSLASTLVELDDGAGLSTQAAPLPASDFATRPIPSKQPAPETVAWSRLFDRIRALQRYHDLSYLIDEIRQWAMHDLRQWALDTARHEAEIRALLEEVRSKDRTIHQLWQWHRDRGYTIALNRSASRAKRRFRRWSRENRAWIDKIDANPEVAEIPASTTPPMVETVPEVLADVDLAIEELWSSSTAMTKSRPLSESEHLLARRLVEATRGPRPTYSPKRPCASADDAPKEDVASPSPMRKSVAIYTAIAGNRSVPEFSNHPHPECDFICFTDSPIAVNRPWQLREPDYFNADPDRTASYLKVHPHLYLHDYEWSIWVDPGLLVRVDLATLMRRVEEPGERIAIATFRHPDRDCVYDEAEELIRRRGPDPRDLIERQVEHYRHAGYPAHAGLCETTVLVRRHNEAAMVDLMAAWWREIDNGSKLDRLSLSYVAHQHSVPIRYLELEDASVRLDTGFAPSPPEQSFPSP